MTSRALGTSCARGGRGRRFHARQLRARAARGRRIGALPRRAGTLGAVEALNFYNPLVADQLRSRRKTVTIRLGDKSAKYRKGLCLKVLCGQRFGPRTHVFDAVVDKVEVKRLGDVSPRELQHDNPELRTLDEFVVFLGQLYNRDVSDEDTVTVIHFSEIRPSARGRSGRLARRRRTRRRPRRRTAGASRGAAWRSGLRRIGRPKNSASRSASPQPEQVICMSDVMPSPQAGQDAITGCAAVGALLGELDRDARRGSAVPSRSRRRTRRGSRARRAAACPQHTRARAAGCGRRARAGIA